MKSAWSFLKAQIPELSILKGRFVSDSLTLVIGLLAAQSVTLVASPFLTRIYSPAEFGVFANFSTLVGIASVVICLSYETAVVLPDRDSEAVELVWLCLSIAGTLAVISFFAVLAWGPAIGAAVNAPELVKWLEWAPAYLLLAGGYQSLNYWATRRRQFAQISVSRVGQSIATAGLQVAGSGVGGLVHGMLAGQVVATMTLLGSDARSSAGLWSWARPRVRSLVANLHRYRRFPLYSSWGTLMNSASFLVVPLLLSSFFGPIVAGLYFLGYRLATIPVSLIGSAVGQVLLQRAAEQLAAQGRIDDLVEKVLGRLVILGAPPFAALALLGPFFFGLVFGREWATAGVYLRILTPLFFLQFLTSPMSMVLIALQRQSLVAAIQAAMLVGALATLFAGSRLLGTPAASLAAYSLVQAVIYLLYLAAVVRCSAASPRKILAAAFRHP